MATLSDPVCYQQSVSSTYDLRLQSDRLSLHMDIATNFLDRQLLPGREEILNAFHYVYMCTTTNLQYAGIWQLSVIRGFY